MPQPYLGEVRMFAGSSAPTGWMFCEGQLLPIAGNEALFLLIGTSYGGDGETTFGLPDLRGRIPIHHGNGFVLSEPGGVEEATLAAAQIPVHSHPLLASTGVAVATDPASNVLGQTGTGDLYLADVSSVNMALSAVAAEGEGQPHTNFQPYLCVNFIMSLSGSFPAPS